MTDPPAAVRLGSEALPAIDASGTIGQRLDARRLLAMACAHTNDFDRALALCREGIALPGADRAPVERARVRLASMQPLAMTGDTASAIAEGETALGVFENLDRTELAGRAALNIGSIHAMTGRPGEALPFFDRARGHLGETDPMTLGQVETNRGTALAALDRFREAEGAFERAAALLDSESGEMSWAVAIAESNLADLAVRQGDIERALHYFEASRRHFEHDEAWGDLGRIDAEEAAMLSTLGLTATARDAFTSAIDRLRTHGTPSDLAAAEIAYATALLDAGELGTARDVLGNTSDRIDRDQNIELYRQLLLLQARISIAQERFDEAARLIDAGVRLVDELPIQRLRWVTLQAMAAERAGNLDRAREILDAALADAEAARVTPLVGELHESLSRVSRALGDIEPANAHARQAIAAFETIRGAIQANRLRQSWHRERLSAYTSLYRSLVGRDDAAAQAEAFNVAEQIRGRMLLDALHRDSTADSLDAAMSESEQALVERLREHRRWLNWIYSAVADGMEPEAGLLAQIEDREVAANQLADRLATLRPRARITTPLSLDDVLRSIDDTTAILSYLAVGDSLSVQVITRSGIAGAPDITTMPDLDEQVAALQFQIGRALVHGDAPVSARREARLQRDADAALSRLHDTLVGPIGHLLAGMSRIVVVPSGSLYAVPFAALRTADGYLVDRLEIVTAPSLSVLAAMHPDQHEGPFEPTHPLVAAVPDEYAPGLRDEAQAVAARFSQATLLLDNDATRDAILHAMAGADLVHLACHGRFDPMLPNASGLRVADGWLTLDQLSAVRMHHPLMVLSGCETGRVRVSEGDDLEGMMAALIAAGAGGLVTSLWKTHDSAATSLVLELYTALERQHHPATALRHAQRLVRSRYPHPAMWAPFVALHPGEKETSS